MKTVSLIFSLLIGSVCWTGCGHKQESLVEFKNEGTNQFVPQKLFTANPTNFEVVELNGVFSIARGSWVSATEFKTCAEAVEIAGRMQRVLEKENSPQDNEAINKRRRALPWKAVDCGQSETNQFISSTPALPDETPDGKPALMEFREKNGKLVGRVLSGWARPRKNYHCRSFGHSIGAWMGGYGCANKQFKQYEHCCIRLHQSK
jgi:hypothetical protein